MNTNISMLPTELIQNDMITNVLWLIFLSIGQPY